MENFIETYWLIFVVGFTAILVGFIIGRFCQKKKYDGIIFIEDVEDPEEDETRERIRFVLDLELEDLKSRKQITFSINNALSQNSQLLK